MVSPEQQPPARPLQAGTGERSHAKHQVPSPPPWLQPGPVGGGAGGRHDTYRGFGFCGLGLLQPCFAGIQVQTPVMEEPPLLLRGWEQGTVRPGQPWETPGPGRTSPQDHLVKTGKLRPGRGSHPLQATQSTRAMSGEVPGVLGPSMGGEPGLSSYEEGFHHHQEASGPRPLTEIVFQSPSRKVRRGVRKPMEAVWIKSLSAAPRRFSASATLISVFPEKQSGGVRKRVGLRPL